MKCKVRPNGRDMMMTKHEYELGEVLHRAMALLAGDFPGLSVIGMEDFEQFKSGLISAYERSGWHAAWFFARTHAAGYVLKRAEQYDTDAVNEALEVHRIWNPPDDA